MGRQACPQYHTYLNETTDPTGIVSQPPHAHSWALVTLLLRHSGDPRGTNDYTGHAALRDYLLDHCPDGLDLVSFGRVDALRGYLAEHPAAGRGVSATDSRTPPRPTELTVKPVLPSWRVCTVLFVIFWPHSDKWRISPDIPEPRISSE